MSEKTVDIWYDEEADYLEVLFDLETPGYSVETENDRVMKRIDLKGNVLGFSVLGVRSLKGAYLKMTLAAGEAQDGHEAQ